MIDTTKQTQTPRLFLCAISNSGATLSLHVHADVDFQISWHNRPSRAALLQCDPAIHDAIRLLAAVGHDLLDGDGIPTNIFVREEFFIPNFEAELVTGVSVESQLENLLPARVSRLGGAGLVFLLAQPHSDVGQMPLRISSMIMMAIVISV